jgi:hypothetical protein
MGESMTTRSSSFANAASVLSGWPRAVTGLPPDDHERANATVDDFVRDA